MKLLILPLLIGLTSPAWADAKDEASSDCARQRAKGGICKINVEEEQVEGGVAKHTESTILVNTFGKHGSLIHVRETFIPEIIKTAEDL
ncbi:MAG TPA: hypothetical protein VGM88_16115 [Kofleriaceae bacterium]|jgi:hypothetical protein